VHALLRHLEQVGFSAAPRVVGDGYDDQGREVLTWIPGRILHPRPYTEEQVWQVGRLLRSLHEATASFQPPPEAVWQPWTLHSRAPEAIISHCNVGPWHVIVREEQPVGHWIRAGFAADLADVVAATLAARHLTPARRVAMPVIAGAVGVAGVLSTRLGERTPG